MKKTLMLVVFASAILIGLNQQEDVVLIPKEAIRFRVIANSNQKEDQELKKKVVNSLQKKVVNTLKPEFTIEKSRKTIQGNLPLFEDVVAKTLEENQTKSSYTIDYGEHYFPKKTYKGIVYEEGMYESLVVTLGKGQGKNFWCVLFPPLCSLEQEESTKNTDVEYKSFVKEIIDKYFLKT